jgi:glycerol uptake facilitator-like aquaporin
MLLRRLLAEAIGSLLLAATVVGSGIMAERLAAGNTAVALIANTGATLQTMQSRMHAMPSQLMNMQ